MEYLYKYTYLTNSDEETLLFGEKLSNIFPKGAVILLCGDLGSGKTTLVRGFAKGLDIKDKVQSPTFNIMKLYLNGKSPLVHIDAYRLEDNNNDIGLDEYIGIDNGYTFIEWPDYISNLYDKEKCILVEIKISGENKRNITVNSNIKLPFKEGL